MKLIIVISYKLSTINVLERWYRLNLNNNILSYDRTKSIKLQSFGYFS